MNLSHGGVHHKRCKYKGRVIHEKVICCFGKAAKFFAPLLFMNSSAFFTTSSCDGGHSSHPSPSVTINSCTGIGGRTERYR